MADDILATAPVLRFAPSPNGALHLGHAYSALMNERLAAETGGRLLCALKTCDRTRCKPRFEAAIIADLAWLGLRFPAPPRRQSEHRDDYAAALARLDQQGLVYPCFCSRSEAARASAGNRDPDGAPLYPGTCRALSSTEAGPPRARRKSGLPPRHGRALGAARRIFIGWNMAKASFRPASGNAGGLGRHRPQRPGSPRAIISRWSWTMRCRA